MKQSLKMLSFILLIGMMVPACSIERVDDDEVIITSVSETSISGRVKGGDFEGDKNIEGSFVAEICN